MTAQRIWTSGWALLLVACQPPLLDEGSCRRDEECPGGFVCAQGHCTRTAGDAGHVDGAALDGQDLDTAPQDQAPADRAAPTDSAIPDAGPPVDARPDDRLIVDVVADAAAREDAATPDTAPGDTAAPDPGLVDAQEPDGAAVDSAAVDSASGLLDAAVPADAAVPVDAVVLDTGTSPQDAALPADTGAPDDRGVGEDSATPLDAALADRLGLDRVSLRDGWGVIPDGPIVIQDATLEAPVVKNPSFELGASAPLHWTSYGSGCSPSVYALGPDSDVQAVDGHQVYGCITGDPDHSAGLLQQVARLNEDVEYLLGVNAYLAAGCPSTGILGRLGVDAEGGLDPDAGSVVWTVWAGEDTRWQELSLAFVGKGPQATVFLEFSMSSMGFNCSDAQDLALFDLVTLTPL